MLLHFQQHLQKNFPYLYEKRLLLAVSGGVDSMVMLHLFHKLNFNVAVAHCNFQLRTTESDSDEKFITSFCTNKKIEVFIKKFDTNSYATNTKLSIQLAARKLRYDWFYELLNKQSFDYILTAHHLDDSLETFFINLNRGTGIDGLTGIPNQNQKIIRPLLPFSSLEIKQFANLNEINWREDSSNSTDKYLRNKLRHTIIPMFKEINPNILASFQNTINHLKQSQSLAEDASKLMYKSIVEEENNVVKINITQLLKLPNYKAYLFHWLKDFGFTAWNDIYNLVTTQSGKQVFSEKYCLLKNRDFLLVSLIEETKKNDYFYLEKISSKVNIPLKFEFCNVSCISDSHSSSIFVDEEKLVFPLILRKWIHGDEFNPIGMLGKKKVSKFFKDEKFSLIDKSNQWLLCNNDNQIIWIVGKRQDEKFKVTTKTQTILKITNLK